MPNSPNPTAAMLVIGMGVPQARGALVDFVQQRLLGECLAHQREVELLEVAEPAVDQLAGATRRPRREVALLDQRHRETACGRVERDGKELRARLQQPGQAWLNLRGDWHRAILHKPSDLLFITHGPGTEHRPYAG